MIQNSIQFLIKSLIIFVVIIFGFMVLIILLNTNNTFIWTMISSISALISGLVAVVTVYSLVKSQKGEILFIKYDLTSIEPIFTFNFSVSNDIPSNSPTPWFNDSLNLPNNEPPCFIILSIKYIDAILNNNFNQEFFMKWSGVQDGEFSPNFVHATTEETNRIKQVLVF